MHDSKAIDESYVAKRVGGASTLSFVIAKSPCELLDIYRILIAILVLLLAYVFVHVLFRKSMFHAGMFELSISRDPGDSCIRLPHRMSR